jgi:cell division protein FtsI (penicillin-binding protein 3)
MKADIEKKQIRIRIAVVAFFFGIFFLIIGARAFYLQVFRNADMSDRAAREYIKVLKTQGKRGGIYDTAGRDLAVSIDVQSVAVCAPRIKNPEDIVQSLESILKIDGNDLIRRMESGKHFLWVKRCLSSKETDALRQLGLPGVSFVPEHSRLYPNRSLASQVIGFTGTDNSGLEGIEFFYDRELRGGTREDTVFRDALGRIFDRTGKKEFETEAAQYNGRNLVLTIDRTIQFITEKALEDAAATFSAKSGIAAVMDPETGAVLALAHFPFFNLNSFSRFDKELWRNRAVTDPFEPGSTLKIFIAAAALESGKFKASDVFYCEKGKYRIGSDTVHDTNPYGRLTLENIIKFSSNIGAVKVAEQLGPEPVYNMLRDFGFGEKTEIDCPGETAGTLSSYRRWSKIDAGAIAFGQGLSVSVTQLLRAVSAIANGGVLMKPYIVRAITDADHKPVEKIMPVRVRRVISKETAQIVKNMMRGVLEEGGTGTAAALKGYTACGKTGTAQKIAENGEYAKGRYISSFIGFAPEENPRVAIAVILNEPQKDHYGGIVAAPAFRNIAQEILNYLNVPVERKTGPDKLTACVENL